MSSHSFLLRYTNRASREVVWEAIYRDELPRVYNFFRYRVGDGDIAEDLTAATFEKVWRARHRYRHDIAAFSTWLFTIARHVATDYFRRQRATLPLEAAQDVPAPDNIEEIVQQRSDMAHLRALLRDLPEREQEVIALKYGAELTNRVIAELTGLSESNVGTMLHRIVKKLSASWEERP